MKKNRNGFLDGASVTTCHDNVEEGQKSGESSIVLLWLYSSFNTFFVG